MIEGKGNGDRISIMTQSIILSKLFTAKRFLHQLY
jgi:hypothetical protein